MFKNSLRAKAENGKFTFHPTLIAVKGDWPFVRKAFHMSVGFKCKRVCHLCPGADSCLSEKKIGKPTFKFSHGVGGKNTAYQYINLIPHSDRLKLQRPKGPELPKLYYTYLSYDNCFF